MALNFPDSFQLSHGSQSKSVLPGSSRPSGGQSTFHLRQPTSSTQPQQLKVNFFAPEGSSEFTQDGDYGPGHPAQREGGTKPKRGCRLLGRMLTGSKKKQISPPQTNS